VQSLKIQAAKEIRVLLRVTAGSEYSDCCVTEVNKYDIDTGITNRKRSIFYEKYDRVTLIFFLLHLPLFGIYVPVLRKKMIVT
jgi:hypothetical protein